MVFFLLCVCLLFISPTLCFIKMLKEESHEEMSSCHILSHIQNYLKLKKGNYHLHKMKPVFKDAIVAVCCIFRQKNL